MDGYRMYLFYLSIKMHFSRDDYDFFKFKGKVKAGRKSFDKRKDKTLFLSLSKKDHCKELIFSNILQNSDAYIRDIYSEKGEKIYSEWNKRQQSLSYLFKQETSLLNEENFNSNFLVKNGSFPRALELHISGKMSIETLTILVDLVKCLGHWNKKISDPVIFPDISRRVTKLKPFLEYDRGKFRKILLDRYNETL